jgi:hypothetical protein
MQGFKIHVPVCSRDYLIIVFRTDGKCWQFRIVALDSCVLGEKKVYYTPEAAEDAARLWLKAALR